MKFSKFFQYAYLVFAALFLYDGLVNWGHNKAYVSFFLAALAVFMFFFRRRFMKKYDNRDNSK